MQTPIHHTHMNSSIKHLIVNYSPERRGQPHSPVIILEHEVVVDELLVLLGGHGLQGVVLALQLPLKGIQSLDRDFLHLFPLLSIESVLVYF